MMVTHCRSRSRRPPNPGGWNNLLAGQSNNSARSIVLLSAVSKTQKHSALSQSSLQTLEESHFGDSNRHLWNACCFFAPFGARNVRIFDMQNPLAVPHFRRLGKLKKALGNGALRRAKCCLQRTWGL
jgi:hypothetical protein